jgi:hypothetical protein
VVVATEVVADMEAKVVDTEVTEVGVAAEAVLIVMLHYNMRMIMTSIMMQMKRHRLWQQSKERLACPPDMPLSSFQILSYSHLRRSFPRENIDMVARKLPNLLMAL